jgi:hypothetical protein
MPTIRPVTLDCADQPPTVQVRQQEHPLGADTPDFYITTVAIGAYPNEVHLNFQTPTPDGGIELVDLVADAINLRASRLAIDLAAREQVTS